MLLAAVDAGNSRVHAALFAPDGSGGVRLVERRDAARPSAAFFRSWNAPVAEVALAAVARRAEVEAALRAGWGRRPRLLGRDFPAACRNRTRAPRSTGADRLANAVAAWRLLRRPCVVVDAGTAVTFDVVGPRGDFLGGAIAPGRALGALALHAGTAKLPRAGLRGRRAFGRDTASALEAGLTWSLRGLVREGLRELRLPSIATGGDADRVADLVDRVVPSLTLEGIALSWLAHEAR